jgi:hypothetical protein
VQAARCRAFAQVDEGLHGGSKVATASGEDKTKNDITFRFGPAQGPTTTQIPPRLKPLRNTSACLR